MTARRRWSARGQRYDDTAGLQSKSFRAQLWQCNANVLNLSHLTLDHLEGWDVLHNKHFTYNLGNETRGI